MKIHNLLFLISISSIGYGNIFQAINESDYQTIQRIISQNPWAAVRTYDHNNTTALEQAIASQDIHNVIACFPHALQQQTSCNDISSKWTGYKSFGRGFHINHTPWLAAPIVVSIHYAIHHKHYAIGEIDAVREPNNNKLQAWWNGTSPTQHVNTYTEKKTYKLLDDIEYKAEGPSSFPSRTEQYTSNPIILGTIHTENIDHVRDIKNAFFPDTRYEKYEQDIWK